MPMDDPRKRLTHNRAPHLARKAQPLAAAAAHQDHQALIERAARATPRRTMECLAEVMGVSSTVVNHWLVRGVPKRRLGDLMAIADGRGCRALPVPVDAARWPAGHFTALMGRGADGAYAWPPGWRPHIGDAHIHADAVSARHGSISRAAIRAGHIVTTVLPGSRGQAAADEQGVEAITAMVLQRARKAARVVRRARDAGAGGQVQP